jgi:hypothetical protein
VRPEIVPPASVSVHNNEVIVLAHEPEKTCQYTSVFPDTHVADKICEVLVATNENHTSSLGVPELNVHAPLGVTLEFVAPEVD